MAEEIKLFSLASRGSFFLVSCLAIPFIGRMGYILSLWLEEVPDYSVTFVDWTLVFITFNALNNPLRAVVHATGDIRRSAAEGDTIYFLALPAAVLFLVAGYPAWTVYPCMIVTRLASNLTFLRIARRAIGLPSNFYFTEIAMPIALATAVSCLWALGCNYIFPDNFIGLLGYGLTTLIGCLGADFLLGIRPDERHALISRLKKKLH